MKVHSIYLFIDICTYCMHWVYKSVDVNGLMWDVCSVYHHQRIESRHVSALAYHSFSLQTVCRPASLWSHCGVAYQIMNWQSVYHWIQMQMVPEPLSRTLNWYTMKHTDHMQLFVKKGNRENRISLQWQMSSFFPLFFKTFCTRRCADGACDL